MDTSGLSGLGGVQAALQYQVGVEKLAQDKQKHDGAAVIRLIEGAAPPPQVERPDGKGANVDIVI